MALIKCPECGKEISNLAHCCPHCGFPLDNDKKVLDDKPSDEKKEVIKISGPLHASIATPIVGMVLCDVACSVFIVLMFFELFFVFFSIPFVILFFCTIPTIVQRARSNRDKNDRIVYIPEEKSFVFHTINGTDVKVKETDLHALRGIAELKVTYYDNSILRRIVVRYIDNGFSIREDIQKYCSKKLN